MKTNDVRLIQVITKQSLLNTLLDFGVYLSNLAHTGNSVLGVFQHFSKPPTRHNHVGDGLRTNIVPFASDSNLAQAWTEARFAFLVGHHLDELVVDDEALEIEAFQVIELV